MLNLIGRLKNLVVQNATVSATGNSTGVALVGKVEGPVKVFAKYAAGGAGASLAKKLQTSYDDTTYVDVPDGAFTDLADAAGEQELTVDGRFLRNYVRVADTETGTYSASNLVVLTYAQKYT